MPGGGAVQRLPRSASTRRGWRLRRGCCGERRRRLLGRRVSAGATTADVKAYETRRAIFDGAREIDMVINVGALKSGELRAVERDIDAVTSRAARPRAEQGDHRGGAADRRRKGDCVHPGESGRCRLRQDVDWIRSGGATAADVALMRRVVGDDMGIKAAGGVRDLQSLKAMVAAGATRIGASAGVRIVREAQKRPAQ